MRKILYFTPYLCRKSGISSESMTKLSYFSLTMSAISLMIFWVVMSGFYDLIHLSMGAFSVALVIFTNYKLKTHRFFEDDMSDLKELRFHRAFTYVFWLLWQMLLSGFHVAKIIISPKMPVNFAMITFKVDLPSAHARMILGNSITLTPGTLTIDIVGNEFTVHGIDDKSFEGIINDQMPRQVLKLFLNEDRQVVSDIKYTK